jgi:hypothetical protein
MSETTRLTARRFPARRFPPPWSVRTRTRWALRRRTESIKLLRNQLFGVVLCLVGTNYINSANAQQTDQQTIVTKAEAALAAKIKCRDFRKNANGTWTSGPNTKIGTNAFPQHTFDNHGVSIGGADLATVLNRKCSVAPLPQNRPPIESSKPTETSPEPSPSQESPEPNGDDPDSPQPRDQLMRPNLNAAVDSNIHRQQKAAVREPMG